MSNMVLALIFSATTQTFSLPSGLLSAVCFVESSHRPAAINKNDRGSPSLGLCQVKFNTAKWLGFKGTPAQLQTDAKINAYYSAAYLKFQLKRYKYDVSKAVAAYNAGVFRPGKYASEALNSKYVSKVMKAWSEHR
jgi:soluble lytic murein transglycosylase-like protein